ncbi:tRNA int end N2 domain containing protein [Trichuris trichiura]|uniref:tRNA int end N2 domain containing protein n=1 Tax=Trichuris trichiura TaxID=36087 RepID=A0A077Z2W2_TRITR|nr:tRNA int end N2 domain containing protein [Trichuris trichiura]
MAGSDEESTPSSSTGFLKLENKRQVNKEAKDETEKVAEARQQLYASLEQPCSVNHNNMCVIEYRVTSEAEVSLVLTKSKGKLWTYMGVTIAGERHLYPEEAIFLMSMCAARLYHNGNPLNLVQAFQLLLGHDADLWNRHMLYDHLRRAGYIVVRHAASLSRRKNVSSPSDASVDLPEREPSVDENPYHSLESIYDVHLADSGYTFASKRKPHIRVLVLSADEEVPSADDLVSLQTKFDDDCPFHVACVDGSSISFFQMRAVRTVDLPDETAAVVKRDERREDESD